ncbi:hypothetical protein [Nostoc sp. JL31]|uniref:hypothetical protein n=1 Tax=Nostoc sp. JL31 TaxID=2815395 RepID=UPI0025DA4575|nr:hypothetical protein [Nostoc sp. JL31]
MGLAERQSNTQQQLDSLIENVNRVLARSAILDDVLLELRDSHEIHQRNFEEHQPRELTKLLLLALKVSQS